ncbi:MAG: cytochrome c biogenesis protein CcsA [Myxococcota bacterium]
MTATLLIPAAAAYAVASALFLGWLLRYEPRYRRAGAFATVVASAVVGAATVVELAGWYPVSLPGGPRVLLVLTFGVSAIFLGSRLRRDMPLAGPVITPLATAVVFALAVKAVRGDLPAASAEMSTVTVLHIGATLMGFLLFVPAYVLSVLFLSQEYHLKTKKPRARSLPSLLRLEHMAWRLLYVGFPLYSVGILLGFVWQDQASDHVPRPEHVLAALSWCVYAYVTWRRLRTGWRGRRAALVLMGGFVATLAAVLLYVMR